MEELILDLIDYDVEDEYEEDDEEGTITIYGNPVSYTHLDVYKRQMQGTPIALITAGLLAMAFMGFSGVV